MSLQIYTSYFANIRNMSTNDIIPIAICAKPPEWYSGQIYKKIAPTYDILMQYKNGKIDWSTYERRYNNEVLSKINQHIVYNDLVNLAMDAGWEEGKIIVTLCYEKYSDNCHRHPWATWMRNAGFDVKEYGYE